MVVVTRKDAKTDYEPILDPELQEQLRMELYGTGRTEDYLVAPGHNTGNIDGGKSNNNNNNNTTNLSGGMLVIGASVLGLIGMQFPFLFIKHAPFMATPARKIQHALKFIDRKKHMPQTASLSEAQQQQQLSLKPSSRVSSQAQPPSVSKPSIFVDLGSGDGQAVYEAAKLGHKAVGIEFNWTLWAFSSLRRQFFWSPEVKRRSRFLLQDFSSYDLKDADTVMVFAVPRTMPILGRKIQSECSHGTNIMAYRFEMPLAAGSNATNSDCKKSGEGRNNKPGANKESSDRTTVVSVPSDRTNDEDDNEDGDDLRLRATCVYNQEEMRIYRMGE